MSSYDERPWLAPYRDGTVADFEPFRPGHSDRDPSASDASVQERGVSVMLATLGRGCVGARWMPAPPGVYPACCWRMSHTVRDQVGST